MAQVYAPSSAIWWGSYGFIRRRLNQIVFLTNNASSYTLQAASGAMAGIVATLATNPIDVARTRLQLNQRADVPCQDPAVSSRPPSQNSLRGILTSLWREEGPRSLMKGVQPRLMATVPSSIMIITVYEFVKGASLRTTLQAEEGGEACSERYIST
jgi:solute carrier family 25 protein 39/40